MEHARIRHVRSKEGNEVYRNAEDGSPRNVVRGAESARAGGTAGDGRTGASLREARS